jgi:hypothetical protein
MERIGRFLRERCKGGFVADVYVLDIELNPRELVIAAESRDASDGLQPGARGRQDVVDERLVKPRIHDQRNEFDALLPGLVDHSLIDRAANATVANEHEDLRRDDRDLVRVVQKVLRAMLARRGIPQGLDALRREADRRNRERDQGNTDRVHS